MMQIIEAILALSLFLPLVTARYSNGKFATSTIHSLQTQDLTPLPTPRLSGEDLRKRANYPQGLLIAPNTICGYQSGLAKSSWYGCFEGQCAFSTASAGGIGIMECCDGQTCSAQQTYCVDSTDIPTVCTGTACDAPGTGLCASSANPYCNTLHVIDVNVYAIACGATKDTSVAVYLTTYYGQEGREFITIGASTTSSSSSTTSFSSSSSSTSTSSASQTTVPPTPIPIPSPSKTPIGPIVGGVVGGLAVIAGAIVAIIFILRSKKRKAVATEGGGGDHPASPHMETGTTQAYQPYDPPQPEKSTAYMTTQPVSPPQQYSPQQHHEPQSVASYPQELDPTSVPVSPRPESEISPAQSPVPPYVPYHQYEPYNRPNETHEKSAGPAEPRYEL